jgi:hypothetical protein
MESLDYNPKDIPQEMLTDPMETTDEAHGGEPTHMLEVEDEPHEINTTEPPERIVQVAMDSGAGAHVMNPDDVPELDIVETEASRKGAGFVAACGTRILNQGEIHMTMTGDDCSKPVNSTFQAADVTRALYSVSQICDTGCTVTFDKQKGVVARDGREVARFPRKGGLYVATMNVKKAKRPESRATSTSGFTRPGANA